MQKITLLFWEDNELKLEHEVENFKDVDYREDRYFRTVFYKFDRNELNSNLEKMLTSDEGKKITKVDMLINDKPFASFDKPAIYLDLFPLHLVLHISQNK